MIRRINLTWNPRPANPDRGGRKRTTLVALLAGLCTGPVQALEWREELCPALAASSQPAQPAAAASVPAPALPARSLVIIIDDMGHNLTRGREAIALPGKLNFAFLPYTPHGADLARQAHLGGKEVMLHAPMSNLQQVPLGPGGLTPELSETHFRAKLSVALRQLPHVRGVNNHMGSELTEHREQMGWVMEELRERGLFFVDSRTSPRTIAAQTAAEYGIPNLSRHIFLDNERDEAVIDQRFQELLAIVNRYGKAVAIGHPYPETLSYLRRALPGLKEMGIELVHASALMGLPPPTPLQPGEQLARLGDSAVAEGDQQDPQSRTSIPAAAM